MKKFDFSKFTGKGLAIAVFVCLLAVGGAGIYSYSKVQDSLDNALMSSDDNSYPVENPIAQITVTTAPVTKITSTPEADGNLPIPADNPAASETAPATDVAATQTNTQESTILPTDAACIRPVSGDIINGFSNGELVKSKTLNVWKTHDGIDIIAANGENVKSMTAGIISEIYIDQLMGVTVVIDHGNGLIGYYSNLSTDVPLSEGDTVSAGTIIGTVGSTADSEISEDPHLHFALKKNNAWIDPAALLSDSGS
ncbi:MAG: peptidoglycan DD-metalloendopeptidase family protein [Ruminococcus sp.]|jgi:murein DD-endopeptidase MepM/ murein hydrolase activator NlpD|nr:peptidoglycan DD-metalloendopeptidase family protein [Ruminococcus sp.]